MAVVVSPIKRCNFRFLNETNKVYYMTRQCKLRPQSFSNNEYYTEPFQGTQGDHKENAIIAYKDYYQCLSKLSTVEVNPSFHDIVINEVPLKQFKHLAFYFNMPALVIMNSYCDLTDGNEYLEAHYVSPREKE
jgi:hypothetical protein